jgi:alkanesulfonate monooxygenase SsuD/methylene tetrahydromethanopterin reductase-like flavin-dependent oxidoreductase (luciferase family)
MTAGLAIGFQLWPQACTWDELMAAARVIDDAGFDSIWSNDHFLPNAFDPEGLVERLAGPYFEAG